MAVLPKRSWLGVFIALYLQLWRSHRKLLNAPQDLKGSKEEWHFFPGSSQKDVERTTALGLDQLRHIDKHICRTDPNISDLNLCTVSLVKELSYADLTQPLLDGQQHSLVFQRLLSA